MSIWSSLRSSSSSWHLWIFLHLSGPKEEFWDLEKTFPFSWRLSRNTCDKNLWDSKLNKSNNRKLTREDSGRRKREKSGVNTAQGLWQHTLLRAAETSLRILTLGGIEDSSITFLQRRKTPKVLPKNGKQTMGVCDFRHWLNSSVSHGMHALTTWKY